MNRITLAAATFGLALGATALNAAERAAAKVECQPAEEKLIYDCMIMLTGKDSQQPIENAKVVVGADMPSMPMAHNVRPVEAMPMQKPGAYRARLRLEMEGEWALRLDISGPLRDRLVEKMMFGGPHAAKQHDMPMGHGDQMMEHDADDDDRE